MLHGRWDYVGSGLLWMLIWGAIGAGLSVVVGIIDPPAIDAGEGPLDVARILGGVGMAAGAVFGLLMSAAERRRPSTSFSALRGASFGALAGVVIALLADVNVANACLFGAVAGTLQLSLTRVVQRIA